MTTSLEDVFEADCLAKVESSQELVWKEEKWYIRESDQEVRPYPIGGVVNFTLEIPIPPGNYIDHKWAPRFTRESLNIQIGFHMPTGANAYHINIGEAKKKPSDPSNLFERHIYLISIQYLNV